MKGFVNSKFKETFEDFPSCYTIIGGTANVIVLESMGIKARATKDYDMLIHEEGRTLEFYKTFHEFLLSGHYIMSTIHENENLYRFKTEDVEFPPINELLCKRPYFRDNWDGEITSISFSDEHSLSAIMLDREYFEFAIVNTEVIAGVSVLNKEGLLILKARAWYNLFLDRKEGKPRTSTEINKHLKDVSKLVLLFEENYKIKLESKIKEDMKKFLKLLKENLKEIPESRDYPFTREEVFGALNNLLMN